MNYKLYFYEEKSVCIITENASEKPKLDNLIIDASNLIINLNEKNVENIFSFFKENTIKQLLSSQPKIISIDYSEISSLSLFKENNFAKLIELIENSAEKCNDTINKYIELKNNEDDKDSNLYNA